MTKDVKLTIRVKRVKLMQVIVFVSLILTYPIKWFSKKDYYRLNGWIANKLIKIEVVDGDEADANNTT